MVMKRTYQGFTLIELLLVIAIAGVLLALVLPAIAKTREQAHAVDCMNNMRQLGMAALMFADDHDDDIPDVPGTSYYIDEEGVYICPKDERGNLGAVTPSYSYCVATPDKLKPRDYIVAQSETILYIESEMAGNPKVAIDADSVLLRHDNRTVLVFADGHSTCFTEEQWTTFLGYLGDKGVMGGGGSIPID